MSWLTALLLFAVCLFWASPVLTEERNPHDERYAAMESVLNVLRRWEGPTYGIVGSVRKHSYRENARQTLLVLLHRFGNWRVALVHYGPGPEDCLAHPDQLCGWRYADMILDLSRKGWR
jgi:hypothetical protein